MDLFIPGSSIKFLLQNQKSHGFFHLVRDDPAAPFQAKPQETEDDARREVGLPRLEKLGSWTPQAKPRIGQSPPNVFECFQYPLVN